MFALDGLDWRSWSAADFASVSYLMLRRQYAHDPTELRNLYLLVDDLDAVAALDREIMGQPRQVATDR